LPMTVSRPTAQLGPQRPPTYVTVPVQVASVIADATLLAAVIYGRSKLVCPMSVVVPIVYTYYIIRFSMTIAMTMYRLAVPSSIEPDPFNMSVSTIIYKYVHFLLRGAMIVGFLAISTMILIDNPNCNTVSDNILTAVVIYDLAMTVLIFTFLALMSCYYGVNATCIAICPPAAIVVSLSTHTKPVTSAIKSSDLKSLPVVTYQSGMFEPTDRLCAICLNEFALGESIRLLTRCAHHFHTSCVDLWLLQRGGTCPICRTKVHGDKRTAHDDLVAAIERSASSNRTGDREPNINNTTTRLPDDGFDREHDFQLHHQHHQSSPTHTVVEVADEIEMS